MAEERDFEAILRDYVPRADYEAALEAADQALSERDTHRTAAETNAGRVKELEGKHRQRTHRDAFEKLRRELKVKDEVADDVYDLLRIEPDADEPDEKGLRRTLEKFLDAKKHYVAEEKARPREIPAGEGHSRGASVRPGEPELRVTRAELGSALWMRDNQPRVLEAQRAGMLVIDD